MSREEIALRRGEGTKGKGKGKRVVMERGDGKRRRGREEGIRGE